MFYSQFILAKKGPLGTIWIAAHLERKLRKNQVADTDIGVSVDSILSPDVPIALRLSSHLLLGVVRIYSKKVNYLFDDCSEALLKIKQAFRSTAVDLPPEESTAPYHSITLPETFDLDDFELPDDDIYQGNYVDRHISSKDQITLQDTMDGAVYTSQFGLDERFGDGDTSGLDLDEELFLSKVAAAEHDDLMLNAGSDPQSSFQPMESSKHDENNEPTVVITTSSIEENEDGTNFIEYDQAPRTPGLLEEPNLSNIQETSACDDHLESENQNFLTEFATRENLENGSSHSDMYNKNYVNGSLYSGVEPILDLSVSTKDNSFLANKLESDQTKPQGELATTESIQLVNPDSPSLASPALGDQIGAIFMKADSSDRTCTAPGILDGAEDLPNGIVSNNETSNLNIICQPVSEGLLENDETSHKMELSDNVEIAAEVVQSCPPIGALKPNSNGTSDHEKLETQSKTEISKDTFELGNYVTENMACIAHSNSAANLPSGVDGPSSLEALERAEDPSSHKSSTEAQDEEYHENNGSKELEEGKDIVFSCNKSTDQAENVTAVDSQLETINISGISDLPAPEKLLSVPEVDAHNNLSVVATPGQTFDQTDEGYDTSITVLGKKRSFTESAVTMQSLNSVKSTGVVRTKTTPESVPGDDDLLSSILVGRKSSALQIKETPQQNIPYLKRHKPMPRASASKRKVLMDDMMVLHGDMIRQQLTNTEDIRRLRKKAPCTRPEILMIQKQFLEDDIFSETIFTGVSMELASLHNQTYDLSETRISLCDVPIDNASSEFGMGPSISSLNDRTGTSFEAANDMDLYVGPDSREARIGGSSDIVESRVDEAQPVGTPVLIEIQIQQSDGQAVSSDPAINVVDAKDSHEFCGEAVKMDVDVVNPNATVVDYSTSSVNAIINDDADGTAGVLHLGSDVTNDPDASVEIKTAVETADQQMDVLSFEMDNNAYGDKKDYDVNAVVHEAKMTEEDPSREVENCASGQVETEIQTEGVSENIHPSNVLSSDTGECSTHILTDDHIMGEARKIEEVVPKEDTFSFAEADYNAENLISGGVYDKEDIMNFFNPAMGEDGITREAESLTIDQLDYDNLDYSAAGNNTEFLNYDDDEVAEADDEDVPNAEEARFIENSGWSSRTRAVAKYLQTLFEKEAERKRNVLPIDNLLAGKSRKEASRMFFETLVLKTKDYIHVEQTSPFNNINILPRAKLTKIDF